jgi:hypothetical protein
MLSYFQLAPSFHVPFGHKHPWQQEVCELAGVNAEIELDHERILRNRRSLQIGFAGPDECSSESDRDSRLFSRRSHSCRACFSGA